MIPDHGEEDIEFDGIEFESRWNVSSDWDKDEYNLEWIAEDAADYAFSNNDGWEWSWPVTFEIYSMEDELLGSFCMSMDYDPVFRASKLKEDEKCY
jgi:hypothetical protein